MPSLIRSVLGGSAFISLAGVVARCFGLISMPVLTALLSPDSYGAATYVQSLVSIGSVIALMGIDMAYARYYFDPSGGYKKGVERFCWRISLFNATVVTIVLYALWHLVIVQRFQVTESVGRFLLVGIILSVASVMAQTRIRLKGGYRRMAISIVFAGSCSIVLSLAVAWLWHRDAWALLAGAISGGIITLIILGMPSPLELIRRSSFPVAERTEILKLGLAGTVSAPMYWLISSSDRWFLGYFQDQATVGIYSVAFVIASIGLMLNGAIVQVWFPEAIKVHTLRPETAPEELGELWEKLVALLGLMWLAVSSSGGDLLRLLSNERYHAGSIIVPWLAGGVFFYGVSHLANTGLLIANRMHWVAWIWFFAGGISLLLNYMLIPWLGMLGASIGQCASYLVIACCVVVFAWRIYPLSVNWRKLLVLGMSLTIAGMSMSFSWHISPLASLLMKLPLGLIISAVIFWNMAPEWNNKMCKHISSRLKGWIS